MKAASFDYYRPTTRLEALHLLSSLENARLIAGGQSLVAMLNMRYAVFQNLIDINHVQDLDGIHMEANCVRISAMTRQRTILENSELRARAPIIAEALRFVGHLHTRNRGTIGGSLAHMDPAAELFGIAALLDAMIHAESVRGKRDIPIADYSVAFMTPRLEADEMITDVSLRLPAVGHGWSFLEFAQRHGDFAIVAVGVTATLASPAGTVSDIRIVLSGVEFAPRRLVEAERLLIGQRSSEPLVTAAADIAARGDAISDVAASATYRRRLARILTHRALAQALARAGNGATQ
jgi:carbon-monoxide dehydrogenase medium subunit